MNYIFELTVLAQCELEKYFFMREVRNSNGGDFLDFDTILYGKNKTWRGSYCRQNKIIHEDDNTVIYRFDTSLKICINVMKELNRKYPRIKFKLKFDKSPYEINYYKGLVKGEIIFGNYDYLRNNDEPVLKFINHSYLTYRNKCRKLFKEIIRTHYKDKTLILEFLKIIEAYFYYRGNAEEYELKTKFFIEIYKTMRSPMKEAFKKKYKQLIETEIIGNYTVEKKVIS